MTQQDDDKPAQIDFGDLDESYQKAEAPSFADSIPDGDYEMVIVNAFPALGKESGNRIFKWKVKVIGPRNAGVTLWRNSTLEPDRIKWFKKDMAAIGIELTTLKVLNDVDWIDEHVKGVKVKANVRNKDGYCNIYFQKKLGKVTLTEADRADGAGSGSSSDDAGGFTSSGGYSEDAPF